MNEFILYVFFSVVSPTEGATESTLVYPQIFSSEEACLEIDTEENRSLMFRYLQEEFELMVVDMELTCKLK